MNEEELGPGMIRIMERVQKLLNLAAKNPNAEEAASAAAKANALMVQYNLDAAIVEKAGGVAEGRREEAKTRGGFYHWQRELWEAVARLNFCMHWVQQYRVEGRFRVRTTERQRDRGIWDDDKGERSYDVKSKVHDYKWQRRHRVIGRIVNTRGTIAMAQYLEEAIERLARDHIRGDLKQLYSREANSFRYGAMEVVVSKLNERYRQMEKDAEAKRREDERRAAASGMSTSTTLTLGSLRQTERDANMDFLMGEEGYSARVRAEREAQARADAEAEAEYARWAKAHPEEAAAEEEKRRKEARRYRGGGGRGYEVKVDGGAYQRGREAARAISIDRQAGSAPVAGKLGRQ